MAQLYCTGPAHLFVVVPKPILAPKVSTTNSSSTGQPPPGQGQGNAAVGAALGGPGAVAANQAQGLMGLGQGANAQLAGVLTYLGTCEKSPRIPIRPAWKPAFNDIGGQVIPFDQSYQGVEAFTFGRLTRFNWSVLLAIQSRPFFRPGLDGINLPGDIGTLMGTEGAYFELRVYFPHFQIKPVMAQGSMPAGYRFPATTLEGPDDLSDLGTNPTAIDCIFHHNRWFTPATGTSGCYDHLVGALPAIN